MQLTHSAVRTRDGVRSMADLVRVLIESVKEAKTMRLSGVPAVGDVIELNDGTCVIVTSVHPKIPATGLVKTVVWAEPASK
jgi:hypothetical protein